LDSRSVGIACIAVSFVTGDGIFVEKEIFDIERETFKAMSLGFFKNGRRSVVYKLY
jgi:hypothetical protein